jgi:cytoskeleton protein RodZ
MSEGRSMSEEQTSAQSQNQPATDLAPNSPDLTAAQQGAGAILQQAREARGLHIEALAALLKVPVKKLQALESDRLDLLPDAVFVRALASSVCRVLKIDPVIILAKLPQIDAPKLISQGMGINTPFRAPGDRAGFLVWGQVSRPAVLVGLLLLGAALVLIFLPAIKTAISSIRLESAIFGSSSAKSEKAPSSVALFETMSSGSRNPGVTPVSPTSTGSMSGVASGPLRDVDGAAATPSSTVMSATAPLQTSDIVRFTVKTESWVEVVDAKGQVVLRRIVTAGEVAGASGVLPLIVVVGRADATQVRIRGKVFELGPVTKDNVARFEVK